MRHKLGAYIRVSTDEQAQVVEGSLDNQKHRITSFVDLKNMQESNWGRVIEFYVDDGYSAKDTKRPAYQRMMRDIKKGKINLILVTDLSRLSRSILDFCNLLKDLELFKSKFLSIKENFDTSTPAGEMMIFNMINLAQFERKQTSERVSLNCHARSLRGLMNGGPTILGYDRNPENSGTYIVNDDEAVLVRQIFETYLEQGTLSKTIKQIESLGIKPKGNPKNKNRLINSGWWSLESLSGFLRRHAYVGMREVNKKYKNEDQATVKAWQKHTVVKASWPAIVKKETFERVQAVLEENRKMERSRFSNGEFRPFLFTGLVKCPECARSMTGGSAHGELKVHRYYAHVKRKGETVTCKIKRISADDLEATIIKHLGKILHRAGYFSGIEKNINSLYSTNGEKVKGEIKLTEAAMNELDLEIRGAFKIQSNVDSTSDSFKLVIEQMDQLAQKKKELVQRIDRLRELSADDHGLSESLEFIRDRLTDIQRGWAKMTVAQKKRLLRRLIVRLEVHPDKVGINYFMANGMETSGPLSVEFPSNETGSIGDQKNNVYPLKRRGPPESNLSVQNLRELKNGDSAPARTGNPHLRRMVLYPVELRSRYEAEKF